MQRFTENGLTWLQFDLLSDIPGLKHAIFLRQGGQSQGSFESLNVSYEVGDNSEAVDQNLNLIRKHFNQSPLHWAKQVAGKTVKLINRNSEQITQNCDALVTNELNRILLIKHADCQAAIFYDPIHHAVANVHAGWRGNVANIYKEAIDFMSFNFGSKASELLVGISPSLGPDEAEFIFYTQELPEEFWRFQVRPTYFDLWAISEYQLQQAGVLPHHIEVAGISTYANAHDYFSYRRDKVTGRHATCVSLT